MRSDRLPLPKTVSEGLCRHRREGRRQARRRRPRPEAAGYEGGYYLGGGIFDQVKPEMRIYKEEIIGNATLLIPG